MREEELSQNMRGGVEGEMGEKEGGGGGGGHILFLIEGVIS